MFYVGSCRFVFHLRKSARFEKVGKSFGFLLPSDPRHDAACAGGDLLGLLKVLIIVTVERQHSHLSNRNRVLCPHCSRVEDIEAEFVQITEL